MVERTPVEWAMLPLKKFVQFQGRAPRAEYWWFYLMTIIVGIITSIIDGMMGLAESFGDNGPINLVVSLILFIPTIAVMVRRLHDTGRSGWWLGGAVIVGVLTGGVLIATVSDFESIGASILLLLLVPLIIYGITMLVFMATRGDEGTNEYGPDPYGAGNLEDVFA